MQSEKREGAGSQSAVTGPLEVRKSTWLTETKRVGSRRERKEQGGLEDRSWTSGEEENRGRRERKNGGVERKEGAGGWINIQRTESKELP